MLGTSSPVNLRSLESRELSTVHNWASWERSSERDEMGAVYRRLYEGKGEFPLHVVRDVGAAATLNIDLFVQVWLVY